jgi:[protein-PII] uridylyltransferase
MSANLKTLQAHAKTALKPAVQGQLSPAERIALYKRFLKIEEHRIKLRHRAGAGGLEIAHARAELLDVVLRSLFELALSKRKEAPVIALVAIGGYGRGTLNPGSDIDLLFLLPRASNKLPEDLTSLIQEILYLLWDVGFKVGHACRSVTECLEQAKADQENKTALIEARLLAGDK